MSRVGMTGGAGPIKRSNVNFGLPLETQEGSLLQSKKEGSE